MGSVSSEGVHSQPKPETRGRSGALPGPLGLLLAAVALSSCGGLTSASPGTPRSEAQPATATNLPCVQNEQGTGCLPIAPLADRVDLEAPSFSNPTHVDNPLHPTGQIQSAVYLGSAGGLPFRSEVTLLPLTKIIELNGQPVEVLESQYFATLNGRIHEVALDWYAQADDGSVWYFGEDVFNYEDGRVADTYGTWLAGRDGPAAMIMPAQPQVGHVYRPENIPGVVFEEVMVQATSVTVDGPIGPVPGAIVVRELHMDGSYEEKTFAPGYGEFFTGGGGDLEALALAIPTDFQSGALPEELTTLSTDTDRIFDSALRRDWQAAKAELAGVLAAWEGLREVQVPGMLESEMDRALEALSLAVGSQQAAEAGQAAIGVGRAALDLQLQYRPSTEIEMARFQLMARQLGLDAAAEDTAGVSGDVASLVWIRDRFIQRLSNPEAQSINGLLGEIRAAADGEDLQAAAQAAGRLGDLLVLLRPPP